MRNVLIFITVFLAGSSVSKAQLATDTTGGPDGFGHRWITSHAPGETIDFQWLDARTGTAVNLAVADTDSYHGPYNIGFSFNYKGNDYSRIWASTGGFISFTALADNYESANNDSIPNINLPNNILAAAWDYLNQDTLNTISDIYYRTIGTAPYRKFVIEWYDFDSELTTGNYSFQIVLYETTNLIVFNYGDLTNNGLDSATVGIEDSLGNDGLLFANNSSPAVQDSMSILFYGDQVNAATIDISPDTVETNKSAQEFAYKITNIASSTDSLGRADHIVINNPFTNEAITVLSIAVDGTDYFIQRSQNKPVESGYATWYYYPTGDSLVIKTSYFSIRDSVSINFIVNGPAEVRNDFDFSLNMQAKIHPAGLIPITGGDYRVVSVAKTIAYYTVTPNAYTAQAGLHRRGGQKESRT